MTFSRSSKLIRQMNVGLTAMVLVLIATTAHVEIATAQQSSRRVQADAQEDDKKEVLRSELGERQRLVERKMLELESKFKAVAERDREKNPERAERLVQAYQRAKERLITRRMSEISRLLDEDEFKEAAEKIDEVRVEIRDLIRLLTNQKEPEMSKRDEIKMLEEFKRNIEERIREQKQQTSETKKIANKEDTIKKLDAQIKKVQDLMDRQNNVIKATKESEGKGIRAMDNVADEQFKIRQDTEDLAKEIAEDAASRPSSNSGNKDGESKDGESKDGESKDGESKDGESKDGESKDGESKDGESKDGESKDGESKDGESKDGESKDGESKDGESKDGESKDGESKDGESKDGESKDGESKSGESKSGESKSGESKSGESKSGESKSGESKSGESKSGESKSQQPPQPGEQPLEKAAEKQRKAEEKLGSGKTKDAKREEEKAADELAKAKAELEKELRRIESLPPEAFEQMAEKQRRNRDKTMDLIEKMAKAPKPKPEGQEAGDQQQQQQPGQEKMNEAQEQMQNAAKDLDQQDPQQAQRKQEEAEKKMEQAKQEIEDRLEQLRQETREEKLARLESRFREMLDRQKTASIMTIELDDKLSNLGGLQRRDELVLLRLSTEEYEISELGQQAYDLLLEDGTSIVFPEILTDIREDLNRVGDLLAEKRGDQLTQLIQRDIESGLQELLDALAETKKDSNGGGGGGGGGGGEQPLLKKSAELKILKAMQRKVNRRTRQIERMQQADGGKADPALQKEFDKTAEKQAQTLELADKIREKQ